MTQNPAVGSETATFQHLVELFDTMESLVDTVSAFLAEGLGQRDAALVVMRLAQWNSVASKLTSRKISLSDAIARGQLTVLDGRRTLDRLMLHGAPCRGLFEELIGKTVRRICGGGVRLRVYGDLVDVLVADGNLHAAYELDKMWSDLAVQESLTVLCGYSAATLYNPDAGDTLRSICRSHTSMLSNQVPPLRPRSALLDPQR